MIDRMINHTGVLEEQHGASISFNEVLKMSVLCASILGRKIIDKT